MQLTSEFRRGEQFPSRRPRLKSSPTSLDLDAYFKESYDQFHDHSDRPHRLALLSIFKLSSLLEPDLKPIV